MNVPRAASIWVLTVLSGVLSTPYAYAADATQQQGVAFSAEETERIAAKALKGEIQGPYWTPSSADIRRVRRSLLSRLRGQNDEASARLARHFADYRMQYLGYSDHEKRYIYVNGFCERLWRTSSVWRSDFVRVFDGGDCYFRARYGVSESAIVQFEVNGES